MVELGESGENVREAESERPHLGKQRPLSGSAGPNDIKCIFCFGLGFVMQGKYTV